ncbi:MAG TPA: CoA transferase [Alphaproteobacteria bacterium]|nr:CoA transferase [Alphaproteobacteria bacterium]
MSYAKPYKGIRVIDMSQAIAGPYAAAILARLGADVIKIEPERGDWGRGVGKTYAGGQTVHTLLANLGKRSICVDLKNPKGPDVVRTLLRDADIFIESFRPGVTERLGFGYDAVKAINPRIIYLSVSGFGQRGPFAERPGTDGIMQAFSGFMGGNKGFDGLPHRSNVVLMDLSAALYNVQALQAALWARQSETAGRYIDNSLLQSATAFQNINLAVQVLEGERSQPPAYPVATFETADGYVVCGVLFDREFKPFMEMLGIGDIADDERLTTGLLRYQNRQLIDEPIRKAVANFKADDLCAKLRELRMLHERIHSYEDFMAHPQTEEMEAIYWHDYPGIGKIPLANIPGTAKLGEEPEMLHAPLLGEHTDAILSEAGLEPAEIDALEAAGAINRKLAKAS